MKYPNLAQETVVVTSGMDSVVIRNYIAGIQGGRTLDMEGFSGEVVKAGHIIIKDNEANTYKPMPVTGEAYASLPEGHSYAGVLVSSVLATEPFAGIMYAGEVNDLASPYSVDSIKSAIVAALPQLVFMHD